MEREEESVQPMSAVVASEQAEALRLAQELEEDDATRALAREHLRNTAASGQGMQPSSFFARQIGIEDCDMAVSGRAVCFHCKTKIKVNTVRYSYFHSVKRPPAWVHSTCLLPLVQSANIKEQALVALRNIISKKLDDPQSARIFNPVVDDVQKALKSLEALSRE